jgi:undecaprenyl-diphosphatase
VTFVRAADAAVSLWVVSHRIQPLDGVMWALSAAGRGGALFLAFGVGLVLARRLDLQALLHLVLAILLATLMADHILKPLVGRHRPFDQHPAIQVIGGRPDDPSFPSGHATNSFAGALMLSRLVPRASLLWWLTAAAVAFSRVYLGVHYASDVLAGALVGAACAALILRVWPVRT